MTTWAPARSTIPGAARVLGVLLALVLLGLSSPFVRFRSCPPNREYNAQVQAQMFAEAATEWVQMNDGGLDCPPDVEVLLPWFHEHRQVTDDPWGTPYAIRCGQIDGVPFAVVSAGPDRTLDTADDINSWENRYHYRCCWSAWRASSGSFGLGL